VPWDQEDIKRILDKLDPIPILWLLIMSRENGQGVHIGTEKARNAVKLYSKVRAYAKNNGWDPPPDEKQVKQGYSKLNRVPIFHPDLGRKTVIKGDKPDYLKLTSVGKRLVTRIHAESDIKDHAKEIAELDVDTSDPDWPIDFDDPTVDLEPLCEYPEDQETYTLETRARFECPKCRESVCHTYSFEYPTEAWSKDVTTECGNCNMEWSHKAGNPHSKIS